MAEKKKMNVVRAEGEELEAVKKLLRRIAEANPNCGEKTFDELVLWAVSEAKVELAVEEAIERHKVIPLVEGAVTVYADGEPPFVKMSLDTEYGNNVMLTVEEAGMVADALREVAVVVDRLQKEALKTATVARHEDSGRGSNRNRRGRG